MFPVLNWFSGTWEIMLITSIKNAVHTWISEVEISFYTAMGYVVLGLTGILGTLFGVIWMLCIYFLYLLVTLTINTIAIVKWTLAVIAVADDIEKACKYIALIPGMSDCTGAFDTMKKWIWYIAGVIFLFYASTAICCFCLIRQNRKKRKKAQAADDKADAEDDTADDSADAKNEKSLGPVANRRRMKRAWRNTPREEEIPLRTLLYAKQGWVNSTEELSDGTDVNSASDSEEQPRDEEWLVRGGRRHGAPASQALRLILARSQQSWSIRDGSHSPPVAY